MGLPKRIDSSSSSSCDGAASSSSGRESAVCGLRIDLLLALETVGTGEVLADRERVFIVRVSSSSSSSIASMRPSLPFQVLKRELRAELRDEVAEMERLMTGVCSR